MLVTAENITPELEEALLKLFRNHLRLAHAHRQAVEDQCTTVLNGINLVKRMANKTAKDDGSAIMVRDVGQLMNGTMTGINYNIMLETPLPRNRKLYFGIDGRSTWPVEFCRERQYEQDLDNRPDDYFPEFVDALAEECGGVADFDCATMTFSKHDFVLFCRKLISDVEKLPPATT